MLTPLRSEKYDRCVSRLRFLASKYPSVAAQVGDTSPLRAQVATLDSKIKLAAKLVRDVRAKWLGAGDSGTLRPAAEHKDDRGAVPQQPAQESTPTRKILRRSTETAMTTPPSRGDKLKAALGSMRTSSNSTGRVPRIAGRSSAGSIK